MARSSAYGQMIAQLPKWVLGGEFGDISNMLNNREQEYEQTQNAQLINDLNQMKLEEQQRQADFEEELRRRDIFGGNSDEPLTLRDMYGRVRDVAREMGNVDYILKMEEQLQKLQEAQAKEERQKLLQGRDDQEWEWKVQDRKTKGSGGEGASKREKTVEMFNPETDDFIRVPESQVDAARKLKYIDNDHPRLPELIAEAQARKQESKQPESSGSLFWSDPPPMVAPSPTPLVRGDAARQTPAPSDQVALITRKRAKAVKGD